MAKPIPLQVGAEAPAFTLESTSGEQVSLASLRGKKVVLFFYPKDDTPGCTREACAFRDDHVALQKAGAVVLGVSKDSLTSHGRFRAKYGLPFDLLSDPDSAVAQRYGAFGEKLMYGKQVTGTIRTTVLVDEAGRVAAVWSPVKVDGHSAEVLAAITSGARGARATTPQGAAPAPTARAAGSAAATNRPTQKKAGQKKASAKKATAKKATTKRASTKKASTKKAAKRPAARRQAAARKPAARKGGAAAS